jgi:cell division transport system ATP-binding protein
MSKEVMDVLETINKELGSTVIMATHDKDIVNTMKKRVIYFENGVLVSDKKKGSYILHETTKNN